MVRLWAGGEVGGEDRGRQGVFDALLDDAFEGVGIELRVVAR